MAATSRVGVRPVTVKPGGGASTLSPWLIQTLEGLRASRPSQSAQGALKVSSAGPYSRVRDWASCPPMFRARSCMP